MVLFGTNNNNGTTVILFKNNYVDTDKNVYGLTSSNSVYPTQQKIDIQVIGNKEIKLKTQLFVSATLLEVRNNFLNLAFFVVDDYRFFDNKLFEDQLGLSLYNKSAIDNGTSANLEWIEDHRFLTKDVQIVNSNKLPENPQIQQIPNARIISIDQSYDDSLKNGLLNLGDQVCGIVYGGNDSRTYCIHSYDIEPYLYKVLSFMNKFLQNSVEKIASLTRPNIMESIIDDISPTVCHIGITYYQNVQAKKPDNLIAGVYIDSILKYLNLPTHGYNQFLEMSAMYKAGYPVQNLANSSTHLTQKFAENELNTRFVITIIQYTDIITGKLASIDWTSGDIINNNFDDYGFRSDPETDVYMEYVKMIRQSDGTVKLVKENVRLTPMPTSETINGRTFPRSSSQIPGLYLFLSSESTDWRIISGKTTVDPTKSINSIQDVYIRGIPYNPGPNPYNPYNPFPRRLGTNEGNFNQLVPPVVNRINTIALATQRYGNYTDRKEK